MERMNTTQPITERPVRDKKLIDLPIHVRAIGTGQVPANTPQRKARFSQYVGSDRNGLYVAGFYVGDLSGSLIGAGIYSLAKDALHGDIDAVMLYIVANSQCIGIHSTVKR